MLDQYLLVLNFYHPLITVTMLLVSDVKIKLVHTWSLFTAPWLQARSSFMQFPVFGVAPSQTDNGGSPPGQIEWNLYLVYGCETWLIAT